MRASRGACAVGHLGAIQGALYGGFSAWEGTSLWRLIAEHPPA